MSIVLTVIYILNGSLGSGRPCGDFGRMVLVLVVVGIAITTSAEE